MTLNAYQRLAARTINPKLSNDELIEHALFGLASEVGELHGIFQKRLQGHGVDVDHVVKEAGDVLWMLAELCTAYDFDMDDVAAKNIDKLMARYPRGFSEERSLHRADGDV